MAKTANGTTLGQFWDSDAATPTYDAEYAYAGKSGSAYYFYILKFKTPAFSGNPTKIALGMSLSKAFAETVNLRYALCTSDANFAKYCYTANAVEDSYQIASGNQTMANLTVDYKTYTIEITTDELKPNTTYYLYLWGHDPAYEGYMLGLNTHNNHVVTVTYKPSGGARVGNKLHVVAIYTNGAWKRYVPVVYSSGGWKRQG